MPYLFEALSFPTDSRMTDIWHNTWIDDPSDDEIAMGHFIRLPADQDANVESDFLSSHLPFHVGGFAGIYPNGDPFMFIMSKVPASLSEQNLVGDDEFAVLRESFDRAMLFNPNAILEAEILWTSEDLRYVYSEGDVAESAIEDWPVADLLLGILAECCYVPLVDIVDGHQSGCAFPATTHACQDSVFNDVFAAWQKRLNRSPAVAIGGDETSSDDTEDANSLFALVSYAADYKYDIPNMRVLEQAAKAFDQAVGSEDSNGIQKAASDFSGALQEAVEAAKEQDTVDLLTDMIADFGDVIAAVTCEATDEVDDAEEGAEHALKDRSGARRRRSRRKARDKKSSKKKGKKGYAKKSSAKPGSTA